MEPFHIDARGNDIIPIWSLNQNLFWCTLSGHPNDIPTKAASYMSSIHHLLSESTPAEVKNDLDWTRRAVWYNPEEHWLGWTPRESIMPAFDDPIGFVFDSTFISVIEEEADVGTNSEDGSPRMALAGYRLNDEWTHTAVSTAQRLYSICRAAAAASDFYNEGPWTGVTGDLPHPLDESHLTRLHWNMDAAQQSALEAKKTILSLLGFLSWFQTIQPLWSSAVSEEDRLYAQSLRLKDRPKTGVLYNLGRDYHEMNFRHLLQHDVPIHYPWTDVVKGEARFLRLSPEFWNEYSVVKEASGGREPDLCDMPSYSIWQEDLDRYDWLFQDLKSGKRGGIVSGFKPNWEYRIVDFRLYGAHTVLHWNTIRAYAERFKATTHVGRTGTVCIFFRQNPLHLDEPPFVRIQPREHEYELADFAEEERGEYVLEEDTFFEATSIVRERVKNKWAPRPGRLFSSFTGYPDGAVGAISHKRRGGRLSSTGSSTSHGEGSSHFHVRVGEGMSIPRVGLMERLGDFVPGGYVASEPSASAHEEVRGTDLQSQWARHLAAAGSSRCRSSRSLSPTRQNEESRRRRSHSLNSNRTHEASKGVDNFDEEYRDVALEEDDDQFVDASDVTPEQGDIPPAIRADNGGPIEGGPSSLDEYDARFPSREAAVDAIEDWVPSVLEWHPVMPALDGLSWNAEWLENAIIVCHDERNLVRLKAIAVCYGMGRIEDVLTLALQFGMSFSLYVKMGEVRRFSDHQISALRRRTLASLYTPGYADVPLTYGLGGAALFGQYEGQLFHLLDRPHAVAFIAMGGILRYVASLFNEDLVHRFIQGPSIQVSEHMKGASFLLTKHGEETFYTTDQVSNSEISLLLGHLPHGHPNSEATLWPTPALLESKCPHFRGYISKGAYAIFENLRVDIMVNHKYVWRTRVMWKEYFRVGSYGKYAPKVVPATQDFEDGMKLFARSFPIDWTNKVVADILIPEEFDPLADRD
ncbi:hypothetical protein C8R44DRAFT_726232 [Mycena epipterygia]|nr:hypothetical protein C8R44DRAFT_726232 [Mycena epipterygia]